MSLSPVSSLAAAGLVLAAASASPLLANGIRVADNPGAPTFTSLQAAIDAAPDGGLLLVQSGTYGAAVVDGKSLSIVEMPGAVAKTTGTLRIRNLSASQRVLVSGLEILGVGAPGVVLQNNVGTARLQGCKITGGRVNVTRDSDRGESGIEAHAAAQVVLVDCQVFGGNAFIYSGTAPQPGGHGLSAIDSYLALYDCAVRGGEGSVEGNPTGGDGGDGVRVDDWGIFASGCTFRGGNGGGGDYIGCNGGGLGGDALQLEAAQAVLLDVTLTAGPGGWNSCGPPAPGGTTIQNNGGVVSLVPGTRRKLAAAALSSDDGFLTITATGQPGESFYLVRSWSTLFAYQGQWHGVWTLPWLSAVHARGVIPPSGVLVMQVPTPSLVAMDHRLELLQGFCVDASNQRYLTGPVHVEHLDAAGGPDCDASGVNDFVQLIGGAPDCNRNVNLDSCDIAGGSSQDGNMNGIPDECPGG